MLRLGGVASNTYLVAFPGIKEHFQRQGLDLDWVSRNTSWRYWARPESCQ